MSAPDVQDVLDRYSALTTTQRGQVQDVVCCSALSPPGETDSQEGPLPVLAAGPRVGLVRRVGGVWRYSDEALSAVLVDAMRDIGHPPTVAEFDAWREEQAERAAAAGANDVRLPSAGPYRRRWGSWLAALAHHGGEGTVFQVSADGFEWRRAGPDPDAGLPADLPVAKLSRTPDAASALPDELVRALLDAWGRLPRRSRFILTDRLELMGPQSTYRALGQTLGISGRRAHQVRREAFSRLCREVLGLRAGDDARDELVQTLRRLAL